MEVGPTCRAEPDRSPEVISNCVSLKLQLRGMREFNTLGTLASTSSSPCQSSTAREGKVLHCVSVSQAELEQHRCCFNLAVVFLRGGLHRLAKGTQQTAASFQVSRSLSEQPPRVQQPVREGCTEQPSRDAEPASRGQRSPRHGPSAPLPSGAMEEPVSRALFW